MTPLLVSLPWAVLCGGLLYALIRVQDRAHAERQQLLQRIQAPEQAVIEHAAQPDDDRVCGSARSMTRRSTTSRPLSESSSP
jgi:hypothetical protein